MRHALDLLKAEIDPVPVPGDDGLRLYDPLIGSWEIRSRWFAADGSTREADGEWHFSRILGGLGVQDVLFAKGSPPSAYGTTIRCWDAAGRRWRVAWMMPTSGEFATLLGRREGDRIVQEVEGDGVRRERWVFSELGPDSFVWSDEVSTDGGATWRLEQEMRGRRTAAGDGSRTA